MNVKSDNHVDKWSGIGIVAMYIAIAILMLLSYMINGSIPVISLPIAA